MKQKCVNFSVTKTKNHINYHKKEFILNDNDDDDKIIIMKYDLHFDQWYANATVQHYLPALEINFLQLSTVLLSVFSTLEFGDGSHIKIWDDIC